MSAVSWIVRCVPIGLTSVVDSRSGSPPFTVVKAILLTDLSLFAHPENGDNDADCTGCCGSPGPVRTQGSCGQRQGPATPHLPLGRGVGADQGLGWGCCTYLLRSAFQPAS